MEFGKSLGSTTVEMPAKFQSNLTILKISCLWDCEINIILSRLSWAFHGIQQHMVEMFLVLLGRFYCIVNMLRSLHTTIFFRTSLSLAIDVFTVSLHNRNGRHLPAVKAVQGDCQWPLKTWKFAHVSPHCDWSIPTNIWTSRWLKGDASQLRAMPHIPTWNCRSVIYHAPLTCKNSNDPCDLDLWPRNGTWHMVPIKCCICAIYEYNPWNRQPATEPIRHAEGTDKRTDGMKSIYPPPHCAWGIRTFLRPPD